MNSILYKMLKLIFNYINLTINSKVSSILNIFRIQTSLFDYWKFILVIYSNLLINTIKVIDDFLNYTSIKTWILYLTIWFIVIEFLIILNSYIIRC